MFERLSELSREAWRPVLHWRLALASFGFAWVAYLLKTADGG